MRSIFYTLLCFVTLIPLAVYGQERKVYSPLVDIPGNGPQSFEQYINFLYGASISIAALLAVVKIIIAGAKYMVSDLISGKESAKSDIQGAILGLLLILGAVIILEFINPQLVKRNIQFQDLPKRPEVTAGASASVSPVVTNAMAILMNPSCGVSTDRSTPELAIVSLDASTCPKNESGAAIGAFTRACTGVVKYNTEKLIVDCSMAKNSLSAIAENPNGAVQFPLSNYLSSTLANPPYLSKNGAVWSLSPLAFCETYAAGGVTTLAQNNLLNSCKKKAQSDMEDFCENNAGKTDKTNTSYVCQLPKISKPYNDFEKEYLKNRAATDTDDFSTEIFKKMCEEMIPKAELVDLDLDLSNIFKPWTDYSCVRY